MDWLPFATFFPTFFSFKTFLLKTIQAFSYGCEIRESNIKRDARSFSILLCDRLGKLLLLLFFFTVNSKSNRRDPVAELSWIFNID